jgi:hypothetical protein
MAQNGLRKWVSEKWVDIGTKRKDGSFAPCGRSKGEKRKGYPKCVPLAKARAMSEGQRRSAVQRKKQLVIQDLNLLMHLQKEVKSNGSTIKPGLRGP